MIQMIKDLLRMGEQPDYSKLVKQGAIILDVRSKGEFAGGHIKNAINIPVDQLSKNLFRLKQKDQPIICCCASGVRSGSAQRILRSHGYAIVFNGGSWSSLQTKL